ncbi:MAG: ABC transporter substrate-binding protein [Oscillospiraceae bacterium]|jgi:iron complex transport system substrate-binding protein|nr:ABC transporter substrate-binding protein [Oscillospiraceae bacterium]
MKRKIIALLIGILLPVLSACGAAPASGSSQGAGSPQASSAALPTADPSGAPISIPENIDSIVVLAPSLAETVTALGLGDKITGYDLNSVGLAGLPEGVPTFDTVNPDVEQLTALAPDVLLVSSLSLYDQEAPYQPLIDAGVCVICVPTSVSIENVKSDIQFLAAALRVPEKGQALLEELNAALEELAAAAKAIPQEERKSVYFEISAAPYLYSTGSGTYLDEMIRWVGGENILAGQEGWISVEGESVAAANPDMIFTNVNYIENPVEEILGREGWADVTAVAEKEVYYIDNMASSLPNQNIVKAMRQMAQALYPDYYAAAA